MRALRGGESQVECDCPLTHMECCVCGPQGDTVYGGDIQEHEVARAGGVELFVCIWVGYLLEILWAGEEAVTFSACPTYDSVRASI